MIEMTVDGNPVSIDLDAELEVGDVDRDMNQVAAQMAYWGSIHAAAESERLRTEAYYRNWKAQRREKELEIEPKLAEWKVNAKVQAHPKYMPLWEAQAAATRNSVQARAVFESFKIKANMLQSKGAMMRSELSATDMKTPAAEPKKKKKKKVKKRPQE
jgi:hypothetical protein